MERVWFKGAVDLVGAVHLVSTLSWTSLLSILRLGRGSWEIKQADRGLVGIFSTMSSQAKN